MEKKDFRKLYEDLVMSDWFKKAYHDKSLGECPFEIPELNESEDERIRRELIEFIRWSEDRGMTRHDFHQAKRPSEWIAYLEKQKDASYAIEAVERIDKYIDENVANAHDMKDSNPDKQYYRGWDKALGEMAGILQDVYSGEKQKEQKPVDLSEMMVHKEPYIAPVPTPMVADGQKPEWSEEDEKKITFLERLIRYNVPDGQYGWVDGHKGGFVTKLEAISMLKSLRPQPKKELSIEKAIKWLDDTFIFLDNSSGRGRDCEITTHDFDSLEEMYDSFRKAVIVDSEPRWKPSEEQMKALNECGECKRCIKKLYEDLQKRYGTC